MQGCRLVMLYTITVNHLGPLFILHFISFKGERRENPICTGLQVSCVVLCLHFCILEVQHHSYTCNIFLKAEQSKLCS